MVTERTTKEIVAEWLELKADSNSKTKEYISSLNTIWVQKEDVQKYIDKHNKRCSSECCILEIEEFINSPPSSENIPDSGSESCLVKDSEDTTKRDEVDDAVDGNDELYITSEEELNNKCDKNE